MSAVIKAQYQLIAGERRWRAAKLAGLTEVPVVIQEVADPLLLEMALIENIQREDLNPIETAHAYERLGRELGLIQEEIGRRTGKDRTSITNALRLLKLPTEVQLLLAEHRLSMGHARAILGLPTAEQQIEVAEKAAAQGLSVRQVEALVQELTSDRDQTRSQEGNAAGSQRQGGRRRAGTSARNSRTDRGAERTARADRDRILLAGRT